MSILSKPSKKLAKRIVTEVGFDHRIEGFRLRKRTGILPTTIYSFQELAGFLSDPCPCIDFTTLTNWIGTVMVDHELADKLREVIQKDPDDQEKTQKIRDLVLFRLLQCKKIA